MVISGIVERTETRLETLDGSYKAADLNKLVGLSYRQLNDWEERAGIVTSERDSAEGWRKFTAEKLMALAVCAAVRRQFSLPLESIGDVYQWLVGKRRESVQDLVAGLAQEKLEEMESNPKIAALLNLTGSEQGAALSDPTKSVIFREYFNAKFNVLSARPIHRAYALASIGPTFPI